MLQLREVGTILIQISGQRKRVVSCIKPWRCVATLVGPGPAMLLLCDRVRILIAVPECLLDRWIARSLDWAHRVKFFCKVHDAVDANGELQLR
jgi:hypothetical protein